MKRVLEIRSNTRYELFCIGIVHQKFKGFTKIERYQEIRATKKLRRRRRRKRNERGRENDKRGKEKKRE